eukprot:TRINITY_DN18074_c0_g1_i1.p1 TRINITY_DN18074_c0_g1~~TRINITY_DN18074_c0_g1_i1.p1  ORF type:complete len:592 (-),score=74.50 TRINITY_DN18074_c0_g1_i1:42-1817(-)
MDDLLVPLKDVVDEAKENVKIAQEFYTEIRTIKDTLSTGTSSPSWIVPPAEVPLAAIDTFSGAAKAKITGSTTQIVITWFTKVWCCWRFKYSGSSSARHIHTTYFTRLPSSGVDLRRIEKHFELLSFALGQAVAWHVKLVKKAAPGAYSSSSRTTSTNYSVISLPVTGLIFFAWLIIGAYYLYILAKRRWAMQLCPLGNKRDDAFFVFANTTTDLNVAEDVVRTSSVGVLDDSLSIKHRVPGETEVYHSSFIIPTKVLGCIKSRLGESHIVVTDRRVLVNTTRNHPLFRCDWAKYSDTLAMDRNQPFILVHSTYPKFGWRDIAWNATKAICTALLAALGLLLKGTFISDLPGFSTEFNLLTHVLSVLALISKIVQKDFGTSVISQHTSPLLLRSPDLPVARVETQYDQICIESAVRNRGAIPSKMEYSGNPIPPSEFLLPGELVAFFNEGSRSYIIPTHTHKTVVTTQRLILTSKAIWSRHETTVTFPVDMVAAAFVTSCSAFSATTYTYLSLLLGISVVLAFALNLLFMFILAAMLAVFLLLAYFSRFTSITFETISDTGLSENLLFTALRNRDSATQCVSTLRAIQQTS